MAIRAITFDFWGTLFRDAKGAARQQRRVEAFAKATGLPVDTVAEALQLTWAEFARCHREEQRTLDALDAINITANTLGITIAEEIAHELASVFATAILAHAPEPIDGALDAVRAAAAVASVGIVSDTGISPGASLRTLLERRGFLDYFAVLNFSDELRVAKPQAAMFEAAARAFDVVSSELLHIGDLEYTDIAGAKAFGAQAALFTGYNARYLDSTQADHVFTSWQAFMDVLPALCNPS